MSHRPTAVTLMLCEQVIVDEKTKRLTPVNCFSHWRTGGTLDERQTFYALVFLTSGHGTMEAEFTLERLDTGDAIFRREFAMQFADPLETQRCIMRVRLAFPMPGNYQACLAVEGETVALTRFSLSV